MCGFVGSISFERINKDNLLDANKHLICRGPDELKQEHFIKEVDNTTIYFDLIFNRLSIIDLSNKASQPMTNYLGNKILFNGEIFNHKNLKEDLLKKGAKFHSDHSDTEVLINGLSLEGVKFLDKVNGQFSIVFFDFHRNKIILIRDRLGQKPLFFYKTNNSFVFSSNLKTLLSINKSFEISDSSFIEYLSTGVVSSPRTIFKNIYKLKPGQIMVSNLGKDFLNFDSNIFWQPDNFIDQNKFEIEQFFSILNDSVEYRLESDVEISNLISGGIDSTSIAKIFNDRGFKINSFSVKLNNSNYDETKWFQQVNGKYKTNSKIVEISSDISISEINNSIEIFDEPYCDPSTVPSYLIAKEISKYYKVAITGDGGDELLGGYTRIFETLNNKKFPENLVNLIFKFYNPKFGTGNAFLKESNNIEKAYLSYYEDYKFLELLRINDYKSILNEKFSFNTGSLYKDLTLFEYKYYLPEMMMLKIDRTFMANSIEPRSPFVDHKIIEYIFSTDYELNNISESKYVLKEFLKQDFDLDFINRKKMGFVFDIKKWVTKNEEYILEILKKGLIADIIDISNITKILNFKSRVNSIRIWRLYFFEIYLQSLKSI